MSTTAKIRLNVLASTLGSRRAPSCDLSAAARCAGVPLPPDDPRVRGTVSAIERGLTETHDVVVVGEEHLGHVAGHQHEVGAARVDAGWVFAVVFPNDQRERVAKAIDAAVRKISDDSYATAIRILTENRQRLEDLPAVRQHVGPVVGQRQRARPRIEPLQRVDTDLAQHGRLHRTSSGTRWRCSSASDRS